MTNRIINRRRNYFINKRFQKNFIIKFCTLVIIGAILSGTIIYAMSRSTVTTTFENSRLRIKSTADYILPAVLLSSTVVIIFIGLLTIALTLFTSHRIAGPLYRMEKDIEEVAAGNLTKRFNLRKTDEIKALAASLDNMTHAIKGNVIGIKSALSELELAFEAYEKKNKQQVPKELRDKIKKLKTNLTKFST